MFAMLKPRDVRMTRSMRYQAESGLIYNVHGVERDHPNNRVTLIVTTSSSVAAFSFPMDSPDLEVRLDS